MFLTYTGTVELYHEGQLITIDGAEYTDLSRKYTDEQIWKMGIEQYIRRDEK